MFQGKGKLAIGGIEKAFDGQMQLYDSDLEANGSHSFEWQLSKRGMLELKIFSDMHMDLEELDVKICIFFYQLRHAFREGWAKHSQRVCGPEGNILSLSPLAL